MQGVPSAPVFVVESVAESVVMICTNRASDQRVTITRGSKLFNGSTSDPRQVGWETNVRFFRPLPLRGSFPDPHSPDRCDVQQPKTNASRHDQHPEEVGAHQTPVVLSVQPTCADDHQQQQLFDRLEGGSRPDRLVLEPFLCPWIVGPSRRWKCNLLCGIRSVRSRCE